jgi:hypothetical protein
VRYQARRERHAEGSAGAAAWAGSVAGPAAEPLQLSGATQRSSILV